MSGRLLQGTLRAPATEVSRDAPERAAPMLPACLRGVLTPNVEDDLRTLRSGA